MDGRAHGVAVVLADEDDGQLPQGSQVHRLVELPLRHGAVPEVAEHHLIAALVLDPKPHPRGQRQMGAHDAVATQEVDALVEEMHRAALPLREPVDASEQLGHDPLGVRALGEAVAVLPVRRHRVVLGPCHRGGADGHRLLADIEMEKAADLAHGIHLGGFLFEPSDQLHLGEKPAGQLRVEPGAGERDFGLRHDATPA